MNGANYDKLYHRKKDPIITKNPRPRPRVPIHLTTNVKVYQDQLIGTSGSMKNQFVLKLASRTV